MMNTDTLVKMIETQLKETSNMKEKTHDFITRVVHLYTIQLMKSGNIPFDFVHDVVCDIESEVIEIFRKKTYGFLTLEEYRQHKFRQSTDV